MNDLFRQLYDKYAAARGDRDAYTLTGGRFYRSQAPPAAAKPYIVVTMIGGMLTWYFGDGVIESARVQFSICLLYTSPSPRDRS